ncbi:MAG TPA: FecR family protein, partial [Myxococcales bacterium]
MDELGARLKSDPQSQAGRLLAEASTLVDWTPAERQRFIARLRSADRRGRPRLSLLAWSAAAFAAGLLIAVLVPFPRGSPDGWKRVEGLEVGDIEVDPFSVVRIPSEATQPNMERQVYLDSGRLRARVDPQPPSRPFAVITPQLRVIVVGTRFSVSVEPDSTEVAVEEGIVRVEGRSGRSLLLRAGERAESDDARLKCQDKPSAPMVSRANPPSAEPAPAKETVPVAGARQPFESCLAAEGSARRRCLLTHVSDDGLSGQNSTYLLGQLEAEAGDREKAIEYWSMYLRR